MNRLTDIYIRVFHFFLLLEASRNKEKKLPIHIFSGMEVAFSLLFIPGYATLISCEISEFQVIFTIFLLYAFFLVINYFVYRKSHHLRSIDLREIPQKSINRARRILGFSFMGWLLLLAILAQLAHDVCFG